MTDEGGPSERQVMAVARGIAYAIIWVAISVAVFRFGVAALWGSRSNLGLIAAVLLAAGAVMALAYLGVKMLTDVRRRLGD
jgi:hypothetical protein